MPRHRYKPHLANLLRYGWWAGAAVFLIISEGVR